MAKMSSGIALDTCARFLFRLRFLRDFAFTWASCAHPDFSDEEKASAPKRFFQDRPHSCCYGKDLSAKVRMHFPVGSMEQSVAAVEASTSFRSVIHTWVCRGFQFTNMKMERVFALV